MKNTRKKLKNIRSKTKRNITKMGGDSVPPTVVTPPSVQLPPPPSPSASIIPPTPVPPTPVPPTPVPPTPTPVPPTITTTPASKEDVTKLLSDIEAKINALPENNQNKQIFTKILEQLKQIELNDTIIGTLRTFLSKIDSIKIIDSAKIQSINSKLEVIETEIKENNEIKTNNKKIAADQEEESEEEPALSGKLAHLTFPIELLDAVKNCINHARNYDFVQVGPNGDELT